MLPLAAGAMLGLEGELNITCLIPHVGALVARADPVGTGHCPPFAGHVRPSPTLIRVRVNKYMCLFFFSIPAEDGVETV